MGAFDETRAREKERERQRKTRVASSLEVGLRSWLAGARYSRFLCLFVGFSCRSCLFFCWRSDAESATPTSRRQNRARRAPTGAARRKLSALSLLLAPPRCACAPPKLPNPPELTRCPRHSSTHNAPGHQSPQRAHARACKKTVCWRREYRTLSKTPLSNRHPPFTPTRLPSHTSQGRR